MAGSFCRIVVVGHLACLFPTDRIGLLGISKISCVGGRVARWRLEAGGMSDIAEKFAKIAVAVFEHGPDALSALHGPNGFVYTSGGGLTSGSIPGQVFLTGGSYAGAVVSAGTTLFVDNYDLEIGGTLAGAANLVGFFVETGTGVEVTAHHEVAGRTVTGTHVLSGGTLVVQTGFSRQILVQGREYWTASASITSPATP
jgi:hypothetical protein